MINFNDTSVECVGANPRIFNGHCHNCQVDTVPLIFSFSWSAVISLANGYVFFILIGGTIKFKIFIHVLLNDTEIELIF